MRISVLLIMFCFSFVSCKPEKEENEVLPSSILSEEQMVDVLTDAYLAEGASSINIKNVSVEKFDDAYSFSPLANSNIRRAQFDSSLIYYTERPLELKLVYEKILKKLSEYQSMIEVEKALKQMK